MSAATTGPWKYYWRINECGEADCGVFGEKSPGQAWAVCRAPRYEGQEQWEANARLIAAAPDLLEALIGVVRVADRATDEFDAARAAIRKATGEQA